MGKKNTNVKSKIPWDKFQNKSEIFIYIKKMLKIITRYDGIGIADLTSRYRKSKINKDYMNLAAMNVFLGVLTGKAEGDYLKANHLRKSKLAEEEVDVRINGIDDDMKVTDKLAIAEAEKRCKKYRTREAKAMEKMKVFENVLHRTNKLLEVMENVIKNIDREEDRTK